MGRAGPPALFQPAEVPPPRARRQRSGDHRLESADRQLTGQRSDLSLVLASASPRRRELLSRLGIAFTVTPSFVPEEHPPGAPAPAIVAVALDKARAVASGLAAEPPVVVLGADTEVVLDGRLMGKPTDPVHACRMLSELRGRTHEVITGVVLVLAGQARREESASVTTTVTMREYSDAEIEAYVATGEPLDKAGAYAVQGIGSGLVGRVDGCLSNVIGLPLSTTRRLLESWGLLAR